MKKTTMFVFAIALSGASLCAQQTIQWKGTGSPFVEAAPDAPPGMMQIFSNLGKSKKSAYSGSAWFVNGPNAAGVSGSQFIAMPFKPKQAAHVQQVQVALQYNNSGAKQVNVSLYSDNNGTPGTLLAGPVTVTNLPTYFTCCKLPAATFSNVPVSAGTQYWVVADTPSAGTGSDFFGVWCFVPPSKSLVGAAEGGGAWFSFKASIQEPAGAVYGSIP